MVVRFNDMNSWRYDRIAVLWQMYHPSDTRHGLRSGMGNATNGNGALRVWNRRPGGTFASHHSRSAL